MKKAVLIALLSSTLVGCATPYIVAPNVRIEQNFWRDGVTIRVVNAVSDGRSLEVSAVGSGVRVVVPNGEFTELRAGSGPFIFYGESLDVVVVWKVCEGVSEGKCEGHDSGSYPFRIYSRSSYSGRDERYALFVRGDEKRGYRVTTR